MQSNSIRDSASVFKRAISHLSSLPFFLVRVDRNNHCPLLDFSGPVFVAVSEV